MRKDFNKRTVSVVGINIILATCLFISITTATIQISNFPNPFSPKYTSTTIAFYISEEAKSSVEIYDLLGNKVKVIADNAFQ